MSPLRWRHRCCRLQEFLKATHRCVATWVETPKVGAPEQTQEPEWEKQAEGDGPHVATKVAT
ncbi:hypothetical protein Taro_001006 [Colocasia esculenta]|uniref:Uncharacterized protein n=1 Tax=Colocasia esculenta TaxID=4460 RepID=A0A843TEV1_COLES|nr:hypothetical protein [Colocasia esculenta]